MVRIVIVSAALLVASQSMANCISEFKGQIEPRIAQIMQQSETTESMCQKGRILERAGRVLEDFVGRCGRTPGLESLQKNAEYLVRTGVQLQRDICQGGYRP